MGQLLHTLDEALDYLYSFINYEVDSSFAYGAVHYNIDRTRQLLNLLDHPERGKYLTVGNPVKLSESPSDVERSPLLGEHTDEILKTVVGLSDDEIAAAREAGAI